MSGFEENLLNNRQKLHDVLKTFQQLLPDVFNLTDSKFSCCLFTFLTEMDNL